MTDREIFRNNLKELLRTSKVTQRDLANYAEVSYKTVSAWITGRGFPRVETMEKVCKYFGIKQSVLTEGKESEQTQEDILLDLFRGLSAEGQEKLIDRAKELSMLCPRKRRQKDG